MTARLVEIADPEGNTMVFRVDALADRDREIIAPIWDQHVATLIAETGCTEQQAAARMLIGVAEQIRDEEAYARVCARKGLLPL